MTEGKNLAMTKEERPRNDEGEKDLEFTKAKTHANTDVKKP
jgi:hypothetical protein